MNFTISGGTIPDWLWRSQDPSEPQILEIDMSRRQSERAKAMGGRRMGRPMGARPMGSFLIPYLRVYSK